MTQTLTNRTKRRIFSASIGDSNSVAEMEREVRQEAFKRLPSEQQVQISIMANNIVSLVKERNKRAMFSFDNALELLEKLGRWMVEND